ncbi:MAG: redoxin domain-containing protein [Pirellulales bacterium]
MRYSPLVWILTVATVLAVSGAQAAEVKRVGMKIDDFSLKSQFGKDYSLADFDQDVVVVVFLGTECPLAKLYAPRLAELAGKFDGSRVAIVGIDSNQQDSIQEISAYAQRHNIKFPILKDTGNAVADRFAAIRTPEAFVLDKDRVVRYWGRIDDQYGFADSVGYHRPEPTRKDLVAAVDELLAGKSVSVPTTKALGCHIGRVREANVKSEVTYSNQIARIFQANCLECHRKGRIGPFAMTSYDDVVGWGEMIREVVDQGRMPPWHADPKYGHFSNDVSLMDKDKQLIATWVDNGCPEGDPSELPPPREFFEGWTIGEPDEIVYMRDEPVDVPAEGVVDYYHFVVDPGWTEDKWIMAAEAKPESLETVHHILVLVAPPELDQSAFNNRRGPDRDRGRGEQGVGPPRGGRGDGGRGDGGRGDRGGGIGGGNLIAGYAPGMNPLLHTDGTTAMHVKAGSKLVFQLHYTPNGTPAKDRSFVGFKYADPEKVKHVARSTSVMNPFFNIPPGASDYQATAKTTFDEDTLIANLTPHMHTRGKAFRYEATYPDGEKEILLDVPAYDFNWQTTYQFKEPKLMPKGTTLLCTAHWDNSENNLSNPDPSKTVSWGDQTWEEMMIGFYVEVFPKGKMPARPSGGRPEFEPKQFFAALDADGDGKLTKDELPGRLKERFSLVDTNGDGAVTEEELTTIMKLFSGRRGRD